MILKRIFLLGLMAGSVIAYLSLSDPVLVTAQDATRPIEPLRLRTDDADVRALPHAVPGSHVKVFLPTLPYLYTSHAINGAMIKPSDNAQGWEYDMAVSHRQIDETTYEFQLRKGCRFQDGSPFNADAVVLNMEAFKKQPTLYSKIDQVFDHVEKIDDDTVRFHLSEEYGCFMNDLIWMQFYTAEYLRICGGWNGKATCPNLSRPGPYGLGPYVLSEGYLEGDRQTAKAVLRANPYYWNSEYPKVETITVFTQLDSLDAKNKVLHREGEVDITDIPPEYKVETILSAFAKVITSPSNNNIAIHINMINGNPKLRDTVVRRALNEALNQQNLLYFVFDNEGSLSPTMASPYFPGVREFVKNLKPYSEVKDPYAPANQTRLKSILDGLQLKVLTQSHFLPMWRGIESQLKRVGVTLEITTTPSEAEIFGPLLLTHADQNQTQWDLLVWGNDDWFFNHPYTAFIAYRTTNVWSTVYPDPIMDAFIDEMFEASVGDPRFNAIVAKIMQRAYDEAYMLFMPTPNRVLAVNKEVVFRPYQMACAPLWKIQVTDQHWSVRRGPYPDEFKGSVRITRMASVEESE
ncbi:Glutathione-binding protein GsiB precursor [Novipirellula galeiformis]|uniref:Glutathione-binding protein GsiB n=1 Tax=Novipirellula galeiformis TaxID=2528004 RepID=A0A5C6BFI6_9BACT|nr:ABC transporter substrate-binding protein [Novipirellula galeiformis]TWU10397.1 Glutathione-binding protein GsiB precursor [Novipirellula galeiformis]